MVNQIHGDSNVGKPSLYESGDQRNLPRDQRAHAEEVSKGLDINGRDQKMGYQSLMESNHAHKTSQQKNRAPHERAVERETAQVKQDPTKPATFHGNNPSRGARIDKELMEDDEATLRSKESKDLAGNKN